MIKSQRGRGFGMVEPYTPSHWDLTASCDTFFPGSVGTWNGYIFYIYFIPHVEYVALMPYLLQSIQTPF